MSKNKIVLIVEHNNQGIKPILESANTSNFNFLEDRLIVGGTFTQFNVKNRNNRFYTAENFIPAMNCLLERKELLGVIYGELDHPEGFDISGKNASHVIESLTWNKEQDRVDGTIAILTTDNGMTIRKILRDGYPIFVSSRAAGITGGNNHVAIHELFTYDSVLDPGFSQSRQSQIFESYGIDYKEPKLQSINESLGYNNDPDTSFRIYDLSDSVDLETLFRDNKNDGKTHTDMRNIQDTLNNELKKIENRIINSINDKNISPEEMKDNKEQYETLHEQIENLTKYLEHFKKSYNILVNESKSLRKELNENTEYYNHLSNGMQNIQKDITDIKNDVKVVEGFAEHVASETEKTQKRMTIIEGFAEHVAVNTKQVKDDLKVVEGFVEHVAENTKQVKDDLKVVEGFTEHIAENVDVVGKFTESLARNTVNIKEKLDDARGFAEYFAKESVKEIELTQGLLEHVAGNYKEDSQYIDYIGNKVEGIINFVGEGKVNESKSENIYEYLGINEERELLNGVKNKIEKLNESKFDKYINEEFDYFNDDKDGEFEFGSFDEEELAEFTDADLGFDNTDTDTDTDLDIIDVETETDTDTDGTCDCDCDCDCHTEIDADEIDADEKDDETDVDEKDVTFEGEDEDEDEDETDLLEKVNTILSETKKARAEAERTPHFFTFLSESEQTNFRLLDNDTQKSIIDEMDGATYFSEKDVLSIIESVINRDTRTYTEKLVESMPKALKDKWNALPQNIKEGYIAESKFFNFVTTSDMTSFWNTSKLAKNDDIVLIKESRKSDAFESDEFSPEYITAFKKAMGIDVDED